MKNDTTNMYIKKQYFKLSVQFFSSDDNFSGFHVWILSLFSNQMPSESVVTQPPKMGHLNKKRRIYRLFLSQILVDG